MKLRQLFTLGSGDDSEHQAFRVLFETYYERVYKTVFLITKDQELSNDLTQETFIKALTSLNQLRDPAKFESWLSAIASNKARDGLRGRKKTIPVDHIESFMPKGQPVGQLNIILPEQALEEKELRSKILEAMDEMDDLYKQVVVLKYYWNLSEKEIAESLQIKVGTVKSRLHRARAQLGSKLAEYWAK